MNFKDWRQSIAPLANRGKAWLIEQAWQAATTEAHLHSVTGPEVWLVLDQGGNPIFCAGWPQACHEHINDAINEHDIDEAGKWQVVRAVVTPNAALTRRP